MKKALVTAGSRGIGRGVADSLTSIGCDVISTSSKELNTSDIEQIESFFSEHKPLDILVLNTGGPPSKPFEEITKEDCDLYHNQLFYGFLKKNYLQKNKKYTLELQRHMLVNIRKEL